MLSKRHSNHRGSRVATRGHAGARPARRLTGGLPAAAVLAALAIVSKTAAGPYAPAAGQPGSTAMHMNSNAFLAWATGFTNYMVGEDCEAQWQTPQQAIGPVQGTVTNIVCLGRGGQITLHFDLPISDGPGPDFAVFENSFDGFFLELAYLEVSSDGTNFFRFPNDSLTTNPVAAFELIDPTDVTGYASKYAQGFGTPFDLGVLGGVFTQLNRHAVRWIRIQDIPGDGAHTDSDGDPIFDPFPTVGSAGFDLDGIGVIHFPMRCEVSRSPTGTSVRWQALTNRIYQVEYTGHAPTGTWHALGPAVAGDDREHTLVDTNPASPLRLYRVVRRRP